MPVNVHKLVRRRHACEDQMMVRRRLACDFIDWTEMTHNDTQWNNKSRSALKTSPLRYLLRPLYSICTVYVQYVYASEAYKYCTYTVHILYIWRRRWLEGLVFSCLRGLLFLCVSLCAAVCHGVAEHRMLIFFAGDTIFSSVGCYQ